MESRERPTVLIVDDERGPRESLRMILAPNYRVLQSRSGAEALELLRTREVDLVTLDLNMPGMKGEDLMRTMRREFPRVEVIVITGCGSVESATEGIRAGICDYLQKPFDVVQVSGAVTRALARQRARLRLSAFLGELGEAVGREKDVHAILDDVQRSQKLRSQLGGLFDSHTGRLEPAPAGLAPERTIEFLEVLAETIESKDRFMRGHARRVSFYTSLLADRLGLTNEEREHLRISAFLHDLGKVGVPTDLLLRPGALDARERKLVEQHPAIGVRLLGPLGVPSAITEGIRRHHEWWDGTGYPDGIAGEEIPLIARIISIADAFDAMSSSRPYRRPLAREWVVTELRRCAGIQFDPTLTKEFLSVLVTGACDVDPELVADALADVFSPPPPVGAVRTPAAVEG